MHHDPIFSVLTGKGSCSNNSDCCRCYYYYTTPMANPCPPDPYKFDDIDGGIRFCSYYEWCDCNSPFPSDGIATDTMGPESSPAYQCVAGQCVDTDA
jgi:hypothetical protein